MKKEQEHDLSTVPIPEQLQGDDHSEGTDQSRRRTLLAIERSFLAFERTLMSWLRTSLSMISFGFTLVKFFEFVENERGGPVVGKLGRTWTPTALGTAMILIGTIALVSLVPGV